MSPTGQDDFHNHDTKTKQSLTKNSRNTNTLQTFLPKQMVYLSSRIKSPLTDLKVKLMISNFPNQNNYPSSFVSTRRNQQVYSVVLCNVMSQSTKVQEMFWQDTTACEQSRLFIHRAAMFNFLACEHLCFTILFKLTRFRDPTWRFEE